MKRKVLSCAGALLTPAAAWAGAFIFVESEFSTNQGPIGPFPDLVTHPQNYDPDSGGVVTVKVCVAPGQDPNQLATPLRNIVDRFNLLVPASPNIRLGANSEPAGDQIDWESVALHEIGHCLGLNHSNAASEACSSSSALCAPGQTSNYTKSLPGPGLPLVDEGGNRVNTDQYEGDPGADGVIGSSDDLRGDDDNLHYFEIGINNPFSMPVPVDATTYTRDLAGLPAGDRFAANADRDVGRLIYDVPDTEAVMQQGTFFDETQRALTADDVATLLYARSGVDRLSGMGGDDYTVVLQYTQRVSECDIEVAFDNNHTGFAVCETMTDQVDLVNETAILSEARVFFNNGFNWFFTQTRIPMPGADHAFVIPGGSTSVLSDGSASLLANDQNQQTGGGSNGLVVSATTFGGPQQGTVALNSDGTFTYTHDGGGPVEDRFVYEVCVQGKEACSHQAVGISINLPPVANMDQIDVVEGRAIGQLVNMSASLLDNDNDPDGGILVLSATPVTGPDHGSVVLNPDGSFAYTHDGSETTADNFVYEVCDDTVPEACAEASVAIGITLNGSPQAAADSMTVEPARATDTLDSGETSVLANDSDPEGDALTVTPVSGPAHGILTLNPDGTFVYEHDGSNTTSDGFVYEVCDEGANPDCSQATVSVSVQSAGLLFRSGFEEP